MERNIDFTSGKIVLPLLKFALPVLFALFLQLIRRRELPFHFDRKHISWNGTVIKKILTLGRDRWLILHRSMITVPSPAV